MGMDIEFEIRRKPNGTFDISKDGELLFESIPGSGLRRQLDPYGIAFDTWTEVDRQLAETGRARVSIPRPGKASQG